MGGFDLGGATFAVTPGDRIGLSAGPQFAAALEVDDIKADAGRLRKKNVEVSDVFESPNCFGCFATDIDGNKFGLHQLKR